MHTLIFAYVTRVFIPAIVVVIFRLHGWCMLGVFLLPAFTCLEQCQDLLSLRDGMHVCTNQTSIYPLIQKSSGGMESESMLTSRGKSPPPEKNSHQRRIESTTLHQAGQQAQHTTNELFLPPHTHSTKPPSSLHHILFHNHLTYPFLRTIKHKHTSPPPHR